MLALRLALGVAVLVLVLRYAGVTPVMRALRRADPALLLLGASLLPPIVLLRTVRWSLLLRAQGVALPWRLLLRALLLGVLVGQLLPTEIAGDATRAVATRRAGAATRTAVGAVLADRLLGIWALLAAAALGLLLGGSAARLGLPPWSWAVPAAMVVLSVPAIAALGRAPLLRTGGSDGLLRRWAAAIAETVHAFASRRGTLAASAAIAVLGKALIAVQIAWLAASLGTDVGVLDMLALAPLVSPAIALPVSVGGIGLREASWAFAFARYGYPAATGVAFAWLLYGTLLLEGLAGGLLALLSSGQRSDAARAAPGELEPGELRSAP